jgi:hypothetical protein
MRFLARLSLALLFCAGILFHSDSTTAASPPLVSCPAYFEPGISQAVPSWHPSLAKENPSYPRPVNNRLTPQCENNQSWRLEHLARHNC